MILQQANPYDKGSNLRLSKTEGDLVEYSTIESIVKGACCC
jgi:hypothetical protein